MAYVALYRQWRPQDFNNLIGQEHIRKTLANAIEQGKVAHAYLFSGSRGTGKTSTAKILAKALNCEHGPTPTPCNQCTCCTKINSGSFMDVFEIDAASNRGIDEIREIRETVNFAPVDGRYKVYIIDEVHMLTTEAFNALLKTLEEPPSHVIFILATTEVHKVPITIQSRCQRYDFKRITKDDILLRLKEIITSTKINADEAALELIALQADGGMRDALSLLDQCLAFANDNLTVEEVHKVLGLVGNHRIWQITDHLINKEENSLLNELNNLIADGKDLKQIISELILHLRSIMIYKATKRMVNMDVYLEDEEILQRQSNLLAHSTIVQLIQLANETLNSLKWAPHGRIALETMFLKMCWLDQFDAENKVEYTPTNSTTSPAENQNLLLQRIQTMEQLIQNLTQQLSALQLNQQNPSRDDKSPVQKNTTALPIEENLLSPTPSPAISVNTISSTNATSITSSNNIIDSLGKLSTEPAIPLSLPTQKQTITPPRKKTNLPLARDITIKVPDNLKLNYQGDLYQLWQRVKQAVQKTKGTIGLANILNTSTVQPYQINNNVFYLNFTSPFPYQYISNQLHILEEFIRQIANLNLRILPLYNGNLVTPGREISTAKQDLNTSSITSSMDIDHSPVLENLKTDTIPPATTNIVESSIDNSTSEPNNNNSLPTDVDEYAKIDNSNSLATDDEEYYGVDNSIPLPEDDYFHDYLPPEIPNSPPEDLTVDTSSNALDKALAFFDSHDYEVIQDTEST